MKNALYHTAVRLYLCVTQKYRKNNFKIASLMSIYFGSTLRFACFVSFLTYKIVKKCRIVVREKF